MICLFYCYQRRFKADVLARVPVLHGRLCAVCVTCIGVLLGSVSSAAAQSATRGEVGAELFTSLEAAQSNIWLGASAWYRVRPSVALGFSAEANSANTGGEGVLLGGKPGIAGGATVLKAFVDYRVAPPSVVGLFGRFSLGIADVQKLYPTGSPSSDQFGARGPEATAEIAGGPELRIFLSAKREQPRPALFLRIPLSYTMMSPQNFFGVGLAVGGEG